VACCVLLAIYALNGCSTLGYYYQSAAGQLDLMSRARDIDRVLADDTTDPVVSRKLEQIAKMRVFASESLHLPDNDSYKTYADLEREYVVWNVFAAPPLSTEPHQWCFPIVGCVVYRGYFDEREAQCYAMKLEEQGLETYVAGVPAYSTLGWFDDPVLNTVLNYREAELAGLIFHELAHQIVYIKNDSVFNESFATTVEMEGVARWLHHQERPTAIYAYRLQQQRDARVVKAILAHRRRLEEVYASDQERAWKLKRKAEIIASLKARYNRMVRDWKGYRGYGRWFREDLNNAHFAVIAAYHDRVPAFQVLLARRDGDLRAFYEAVRALGRQSAARRSRILDDLAQAAEPVSKNELNEN